MANPEKSLILASNNHYKFNEIRNMLPAGYRLINLREAGIHEILPETADSLAGNALQKAHAVYSKTGLDVISDDSGLFIEALGGRPGVNSAIYAGIHGNDEANIRMVLSEMKDTENRIAYFLTVIAFISNGEEMIFQGKLTGNISKTPKGNNGFGYDQIFIPDNYNITLAELDSDVKNIISHRRKAVNDLIKYFEKTN